MYAINEIVFIFIAAGLIFGWDRAMYSLIAYFIAIKVIDIIVEGIDESRAVIIISDNHNDISEAIMNRLGRGIEKFKNQIYSITICCKCFSWNNGNCNIWCSLFKIIVFLNLL